MDTKIQRTRLVREILLLVWALLRVANEVAELVNKAVNYQHASELQVHLQT